MKITPLEIRQKTFEKAFRGLDKDEVNAFLLTLSQQWEKLQDENKELRFKLEMTTKDVQKMKEVESTLYRTLKTAEDTGNNMLEQATKEATLQVREAQLKSEQLLNDARLKARNIIEDAYSQSDKAVSEMQHEVKGLEQEHQRLESYLDTLLRDLSNLATDALEKVEKNKAKPRPTLSSILAKAANIRVKREDLDKVFQDIPSAFTAPAPIEVFNREPAVAPPVAVKASIEPIQPIQPIQPEVPSPQTPVPNVPSPEIERPRPDIPEIAPDRIERPMPDIQPVQPETPEIQPPNTQPQPGAFSHSARPVREKALAGGSFFDDFE
ncbi:MAG: DivIVA protein [Adhaeribacter sp.]|jgi:cell division initiation protein|nr:DivIVA protein [Adhaeribacter sp.]